MDRDGKSGTGGRAHVASVADLRRLFDTFREQGRTIIGPTVRDHAICYDTIRSCDDLPRGWIDTQSPGSYRLNHTDASTMFAYTVGPISWKRFLSPSFQRTVTAEHTGGTISFNDCALSDEPKYVFFGVRACDLAALRILDTVLLEGPYVDRGYQVRRAAALIVAVNCTRAGGTCFCASMNTGPRAADGFDLALTELPDTETATFLVESGSGPGDQLVSDLGLAEAGDEATTAAARAIDRAANQMGRTLPTDDLPRVLKAQIEDTHWDRIADRCLTCGNCTLVCPTCFCSTYEDESALDGGSAGRIRRWDSCFSVDFSYIHGGAIRASARSRYRQWLMHKLAYWPDQFGSFGCVGCGRCITWCPAGIDITEEAKVFLEQATR